MGVAARPVLMPVVVIVVVVMVVSVPRRDELACVIVIVRMIVLVRVGNGGPARPPRRRVVHAECITIMPGASWPRVRDRPASTGSPGTAQHRAQAPVYMAER